MSYVFAQNLRTIPASAEEQSFKFLIKVVNKTVASATQLAKCIYFFIFIFFKLRTNIKMNTRQFFSIGIYMHLRNQQR